MPRASDDANMYRPKNFPPKDADAKSCKLLNETCSLSSIALLELSIMNAHCAHMRAIIITFLIIAIYPFGLIVVHGGCAT